MCIAYNRNSVLSGLFRCTYTAAFGLLICGARWQIAFGVVGLFLFHLYLSRRYVGFPIEAFVIAIGQEGICTGTCCTIYLFIGFRAHRLGQEECYWTKNDPTRGHARKRTTSDPKAPRTTQRALHDAPRRPRRSPPAYTTAQS